MKPMVYILATCRKKELLPATTLVFKTLRIGFPRAQVCVCVNPLQCVPEIKAAAKVADCNFVMVLDEYQVHYDWIKQVIEQEEGPIVFCDTDMVFHSAMEGWEFAHPLAGRYMPEFYDRFTKRRTHPRLHTSLLFIDPVRLRAAVERWEAITPEHPCKTKTNLIAPFYYSLSSTRHYFFDTCGLLYHAIGGAVFTDEINDCFDHLHSGTMSDIVGPAHTGAKMIETHNAVFQDISKAKGLRSGQLSYLQSWRWPVLHE